MIKKNYKIFVILLASFYMQNCWGQLASSIEEILQHNDLKNAEIGISIIDKNGNSLFERNGNKNFIPASLQKIVTNFSALEILGEDYQFTTSISYTGDILADGNLTGNVIIFGNGDPSLAAQRFTKRAQLNDVVAQISKFIIDKGITCIDGKIISDASFFGTDGTIHSWSWNDIGNYYACNTWSINVHENYYNLYFDLQSSKSVAPKIRGIQPMIPGLSFTNELESGPKGSGDQSYIFGSPYTYNRFIRGSLPVGPGSFKIKGSIPNSPLFLAQLVSNYLTKNFVSNNGSSAEFNDKMATNRILGEIKSPTLHELVKSANLESINLYCESFLVAIGQGSRSRGVSKIYEFLNENKIDTSDIHIEDGSGLSAWNNISPEDLSKLLLNMRLKYGSKLGQYFPRAGESGTLSYMFKGKEAKGKLWAKTGSMQQVMNYAGFTTTQSGELVSFCLIVNRHKVKNRRIRKIHEQLMNTIYLQG